MNVREIVTEYLIKNGFDGLCTYDCGCFIDDLAPCNQDCMECEPGFKIGNGIGLKKDKEEDSNA